MRFFTVLSQLSALLLCLGAAAAQSSAPPPTYLNVTTSSAANGASILQCWQMSTPFTVGSSLGMLASLSFGGLANGTYIIFPPRSDSGLHNAPYAQWVIVLSGILHVTLPNTTVGPETEAWVQGGRYGVLFAADTKDVSVYGHGTAFPGDADTILLTFPVYGGQVPAHEVLYDGPCRYSELVAS